MNNKDRKLSVFLIAASVVGIALAIGAFLYTANLRSRYLNGSQDELLRTKHFVVDSVSLPDGATIAAAIITIGALFITIWALIQSVIQTTETRRQTEETRRQIDLLTETTRLNGMDDILGAFSAHYAKHGAYVSEFCLLAHTIAVGATGGSAQYETFRRDLKEAMGKLKGNCHMTYMKLELAQSQPNNPANLNQPSMQRIHDFYNSKGITDATTHQRIIRETENLHIEALEAKVDYHAVDLPERLSPHLILFDPNGENRFALIWNIDITQSAGGGKNIIASGFATRNPQIIETMLTIYRGIA